MMMRLLMCHVCVQNKQASDKSKIEKVFVTYVGGTEEEDEWIPISRIRVPRSVFSPPIGVDLMCT